MKEALLKCASVVFPVGIAGGVASFLDVLIPTLAITLAFALAGLVSYAGKRIIDRKYPGPQPSNTK